MHCQRNLLASAILLATLSAILPAQTGIITTVAGNGQTGTAGIGGPAVAAQIVPTGIVVDGADNIYIADSSTHRVLRVDASSGIVTLVAGTGVAGSSGDGGPATQASLNAPRGVALDSAGNLYILEFAGNRVRRVDAATGFITTFAGSGLTGFSGDGGPASNASLSFPFAIALDAGGNLYIADAGNVRVRRVSGQTGIITTVAGNGTSGFSPDGTGALNASFAVPFGLGLDREGNLLISELNNARIRRVDAFMGTISTVAGNGIQVFTGDAIPAVAAGIGKVAQNVISDAAGNLFFPDGTGRIRRVDAATGSILTIAGNGTGAQGQTSSGAGGGPPGCYPTIGDNGPASSATIDGAYSVALTSSGHLLISDAIDCRVRRVALPSPNPYTNTLITPPGTTSPGQQVTLVANVTPISAAGTPSGTVQYVYQPQGLGPVVLGTVPLANGSASLTVPGPTSNGSYPIFAYYSGDASFNASGSPVTNIVVATLATPTVTINPAQNPADLNTPTNIAVIVTQPDGPTSSSPMPGGTVQLYDGSTIVATGTLGTHGAFSDAVVVLSVTFTTSGTHQLTANYLGDSIYRQTIGTFNETVKTMPVITLASSANPSASGATVTFTATVAPPLSDGTVRFTDGGATLGTVTPTGGVATLAVSSLAAGSHSIQAAYSGDNSYMPATSAVLTQTVSNVPVVTITANPQSSTFGTPVTFTATVSPSAATGTVTFSSVAPGDPWGLWTSPIPLSGGQASLTVSGIYAGTHQIAANYSGDGVYGSAVSVPVTITVAKATPVLTLASGTNPAMQGQSVTYTVTVTPASIGALVYLYDGASIVGAGNVLNPSGTVSISITLPTGGHTLTAVCNSNRDLNSATSPAVTETVQQNTAVNLQSSPGPFVYGQPITFTASLNAVQASGTVEFFDGGTSLGTAPLISTVARITVSSLPAAPHTITATYNGDGYYLPSTGTLSITVNKVATTAALTSSLNPAVAGQAVNFSAAISPSTATGSVQFLDGSTVLGTATVSTGAASLSTSALTGGTHSITAVYSGDSIFAGSTSPVVSQVVKFTTTTTVTGPGTGSFGQAVSLTASVAPAAATGTIQFLEGANSLGSATISGGAATISISTLAVGAHSITATYSGDAGNAGGTSAAFGLTITKAATSVALSSSTNPSLAGQTVTLSVQVTPAAATGTVQILDGATAIGTVTLVNGAGSLTTSSLAIGAHSLTASYSGDGSYDVSTSATLVQQVNTISTTVTLTASQNPAILNSATTFTATVTPSATYGSQPAGTVRLLDGTTSVGFLNLANGTAQFSVTFGTFGAHSMTAVYSGDTNFQGATSAVLSEAVKGSSTIALSAAPNPAVAGATVTFTANVQQAGATGVIELDDVTSGTPVALGSVNTSNGAATFSINSLSAGTHTIVAAYAGDSNWMSSTSAPVSMVIKATTTTAISANPSTANPGQAVQFTATITPSAATGTVQFFDGGASIGTAAVNNGVAVLSSSTLASGSHNVNCLYSGDGIYGGSSSGYAGVVVRSNSSTVLGASSTWSSAGQTVTFTASVAPVSATGSVQFLDGATVLGTVALSGGSAALSTNGLAVGSHSITAIYGGDANDLGSSSSAVVVTVNKLATSTAVGSSPNPSVSGQNVTFTATVNPASATGSVQFKDGATVLGTVALSGGAAAFATSSLAVGSHSITAVYGGDGNDNGSTSAALSQTVNPPPPGAPSSLTANGANSSTINLSWTASPTSGVTYNVYSSANAVFTPGPSNRIASGVTKTSYSDKSLPSGSTRYYFVTAQNANGESAASNEANATTKGH